MKKPNPCYQRAGDRETSRGIGWVVVVRDAGGATARDRVVEQVHAAPGRETLAGDWKLGIVKWRWLIAPALLVMRKERGVP